MSLLFGTYHFEGSASDDDLRRVFSTWKGQPHGHRTIFSKPQVRVLHCGFSTIRDAHRETQPQLTQSGLIFAWDGRLDNGDKLIQELGSENLVGQDDLTIVAAAFERWGNGCFPKLIGDWALAMADRRNQSLLLAKDFMGTRPLLYTTGKDYVVWSTRIDDLVTFSRHSFDLEGEFVAGLLSSFPATHLTPYSGIHSVPPACFVRFTRERISTTRYWEFDPANEVRYRREADYEEHFRVVFRESVRRRLRARGPVLAQLSGGIDSSAIVCVADGLLRQGSVVTPRLDTVSYYDDSEPNWDERPYFTQVEKLRGRTGLHVNVAPGEPAVELSSGTSQVLLSGTGGDEVTGGIPDPSPELADLFARARFAALARQLKAWALDKRKPCLLLVRDALRACLRPVWLDVFEPLRAAAWLDQAFRRNYEDALRGYPRRFRLLGPLPSFQENLETLEMLRRQLGCSPSSQQVSWERRYPFLDRDLLEFLFAIPREQILRPGHRRSLMRRALRGIVPDEILNRKRKAFLIRRPIVEIAKHWAGQGEAARQMHCLSLGVIDEQRFAEEVLNAANGQSTHVVALLRLFSVEAWLKQMKASGVWSGSLGKLPGIRPGAEMEISAEKNSKKGG
jgi:asparagine synthase (glutamine-hydrolysing)